MIFGRIIQYMLISIPIFANVNEFKFTYLTC